MTLKEELEILRGEPIHVFDGDPKDIPCIETSDAEKLCKNPVVSVNMITYNHEPYIRQAIEGVMMQKTDFEFELIIGEDCSQDKTREICFEYQKKYPDKIRVLWWHENVSKLGGNSRRVRVRSRGEFIALCEGDDYWIDPLKLQKQVDLVRMTNSVMCVADSRWIMPNGSIVNSVYNKKKTMLYLEDVMEYYFHTSTYLFRREEYFNCQKKYSEFLFWYDCVLINCMSTIGAICLLPNIVSVYNFTGNGISGSIGSKRRDFLILLQYVQFVYCSNITISEKYYQFLSYFAPRLYASCSKKGYKFSLEERSRIFSVVCNCARYKRGFFGVVMMRIKCNFLKVIRRGFVYCPQVASFYYNFMKTIKNKC